MKESINEALGVSDERADVIGCLILATTFLAFKRQDEAGESDPDYNLCEGIENALNIVEDKKEAYVLGDASSQLIRKIEHAGSTSLQDYIGTIYVEGDTADQLTEKLYKDMLAMKAMQEDKLPNQDNILN